MKIRFLAVALLLGAALAGCGGGGGGDKQDPPTTPPVTNTGREVPQSGWTLTDNKPTTVQPVKKWTFLVYMNGANDLEEFGSLNVNQMETVGSDANVNLVVQFKRIANRYDYSDGDWAGTRRYLIGKDGSKGNIKSLLLSSKSDADMGKAQTMQEFVNWGVTTFPAQHYAIVVWNHGAGWRSAKSRSAAQTRGVSYDDVTGNHINTVEFQNALAMPSTVNGGKWDLVIWDSSLMQMVEVAHQIRNTTRYIVGSAESPPGYGYPYDVFLSRLAANPDMDARTFGTNIVLDTFAAYGDSAYRNIWGIGDGQEDITQSLLDASKVGNITNAANQLGGALQAATAQYGTQIRFAREQAEDSNQENYYFTFTDIQDFCSLLLNNRHVSDSTVVLNPASVADTDVRNAAQQTINACRDAVLVYRNGSNHANTTGLYIFLPSPSDYRDVDLAQANGFGQRYQEIQFAKDAPNWQSFLVLGPR